MNDSDKRNFQELFNMLSDYYQREPLNANALRVYFMGLQKYTYEQVQFAASKHLENVNSGQFFPKIADFIKHLDNKGLTSDEIIAEARLAQTPFGVMARIHIGHHSLDTGDPFYLKERAAEIKLKLPEWQSRAAAGDYTDHEISRMLRHGVSPQKPFMQGLAPIDNQSLRLRIGQVSQSEDHQKYLEKFEEKELPPVNPEGQLKLANMMSKGFKRVEE